MRVFRFKADAEFEADNLDDAFAKLAEHFRRLAEDDDYDESCFHEGYFELQPEPIPEIEEAG